MEAIILAAGLGSRLNEYTRDTSKCLLSVGGETILHHMTRILLEEGLGKIYVVVGHAADKVINAVQHAKIQYVFNPHYATSNSIVSMACALPFIKGDFISLPCDLVFGADLLKAFLDKKGNIVMAVDRSTPYSISATKVSLKGETIVRVSKNLQPGENDGEITGMQALYGEAAKKYKEQVLKHISLGHTQWLNSDVVNDMIETNFTRVIMADITGYTWCEVDTEQDLLRARLIFKTASSG